MLDAFRPSSGITGSAVQIEDTGLGAVSAVEFGPLTATFSVLPSTQIQATVPNGAGNAKISLVSASGSVTSRHKFKPTLSVTAFTPDAGAAGTVVTIKGVGFDSGSRVSFGGVAAIVEKSAAKKLKAIHGKEAQGDRSRGGAHRDDRCEQRIGAARHGLQREQLHALKSSSSPGSLHSSLSR